MPPASFRFHLTMNTLALGYVIPTIRAYSGLVPVRQCSCRAYRNRKARTSRSHIQSPYYHRMQKTGHNIRQNCGQRKPCAWFGRLCSGQAMLELLTSPKISADSVMNFSSKRSSVKIVQGECRTSSLLECPAEPQPISLRRSTSSHT